MNSTTSGSAYYPPSSAISIATGIFGLRPGASFDECGTAFAVLANSGFEAPPARIPLAPQQFTIRHSGDSGTDAALYVVVGGDGRLVKISLTFGGEPVGTAQLAAVAATKIRDFLESVLGTQAVVVDRIDDWSCGAMHSSTPDIAYAAAWASGHTEALRADDGQAFEEAVSGLTSGVTTALVTSQKGLAVVMVIAEAPAKVQ